LADRLEQSERGFPLVEALEVGMALATCLQAVHERGFVHRDLKPENIFVSGRLLR